jgi:hypothetical protein
MGVFVRLCVCVCVCAAVRGNCTGCSITGEWMFFVTPEASQFGALYRHAHGAARLSLCSPLSLAGIEEALQ